MLDNTSIPVYREGEHHQGFVIKEYLPIVHMFCIDEEKQDDLAIFIKMATDLGANAILDYVSYVYGHDNSCHMHGKPVKIIY